MEKDLTIFCFHHAGGAASSLALLGRDLLQVAEVVLMQQPGREARIGDPAPTHIDEAAQDALGCIRNRHGLSGRYILFGHSMGGLVAHRVAELICDAGYSPLGLVVSAVCPPDDPYTKLSFDIDLEGNVSGLLDFMCSFAPIPERLMHEKVLLDILLERFRNDISVCRSAIRDISPLHFPIYAIAGLQDTHSPPEVMAGWHRATDSLFMLTKYIGGHFDLLQEPSIITQAIKALLIISRENALIN